MLSPWRWAIAVWFVVVVRRRRRLPFSVAISVARSCRCRSKSLTIFCFVSICNGFPRSMSLQCYLQRCQYLFTNVFFSHCVNGFCSVFVALYSSIQIDDLKWLFVVSFFQRDNIMVVYIYILLWKQVGGIILRNWNLLLCSIRSLFEFVLSTVWFRFWHDKLNCSVEYRHVAAVSINLFTRFFFFFRGEENNSQQV